MLYAAASATELAALEGFKLSTEAFFGLWRVRDDDFNHQSGFSWFGNSRTRCTVAIFWRARSAVDTAATEHATSPRWSHWTWRRTEAVQSLFGARAHAGQPIDSHRGFSRQVAQSACAPAACKQRQRMTEAKETDE